MSRQQTCAPFGVPRDKGGANHVPTAVADENSAASILFDQFCTANTFQGIMGYFQQMCDVLGVRPEDYQIFYRKLKPRLTSWKAQSLWARLDRCTARREYKKGTACTNTRVLIIGAGPCGLRVAIEVAFLGGKAVIVEKRDRFSRNNVLHLWPYLIHDLKALGAKKFFGKFCASSIDHISIRTLQCILLKSALLVGVEVHPGVTFENILEPIVDRAEGENVGWRVKVAPQEHPVNEFQFDVLLGADGTRNTLAGFRRKEFRGKLAIAVTANFINHNSQQEARVEEISGVAFIFNQKFFRDLNRKTNIDLENIVYYKDETHYFVMTAKKHSLLMKGVILQDFEDPERLLARSNVDQDALMAYAKEAAEVSTNQMLPDLEFAHNHYGQADVAMFDFTSMYHAEHASRVIERSGYKLLVGLVGDSLLEPFWPMGTGCARGFLGALDTAWMIRSWVSGRQTPLEVMAERESIYQLLSQTTPENTCKNFSQYTIDPKTRYNIVNPHYVLPHQVKHQYDGGDIAYLNKIVHISEQNCKRYEWMRDQHYLLKWFQRQLEPYRRLIKVLDMSSSWRSGIALCSLIHNYRPDLLDVFALSPNKVSDNNQLAFDLAEKEFGIPSMMSGEDMAMCDTPDLVTMVSYLSQFYEYFRKESVKVVKEKKTPESLQARLARMSKINTRIRQRKDEDREDKENQQGEGAFKRPLFSTGVAQKRIKEMNNENDGEGVSDNKPGLDMVEIKKRLGVRKDPTLRGLEAGMLGKNTVSMLAEDLAKKFRGEEVAPPTEVKKLNPQPPALGQAAPVDVCYFCEKKVYLVEKCAAEGIHFHRGCFRCYFCGTNLRLGAYTFQRGENDKAMFFCFQHYGMTKPPRRAKKRIYADNGAQLPGTPPTIKANREAVDGLNSTPERIEFDIESEQEESEFEQTAHNLSGSLLGIDSDSDSDESSDDELHWSDREESDGQISWADLAVTYRRQLRRSMRCRHSQQRQGGGGGTDSDDTATIGSSEDSWPSGSETEKESDADDLKEPPRRKKIRRQQEVKPQSKFTLDPLGHSCGVDTKPSPTSVEMMRNRMSFFSTVSEPVRIDAHEFLGLIPPAKLALSWSDRQEMERTKVQTGKVEGGVLSRLSAAVKPVAIATTSEDESETEKCLAMTENVASPVDVLASEVASSYTTPLEVADSDTTPLEVADSDTTPTEPSQVSSAALAEQEDSEIGEDFDSGEGSEEEESVDEDENEMKECMKKLLAEEADDDREEGSGEGESAGGKQTGSSDLSDYNEKLTSDDVAGSDNEQLSDELLDTDLLVKNAKDVLDTDDMLRDLTETDLLDASKASEMDNVLEVDNVPDVDNVTEVDNPSVAVNPSEVDNASGVENAPDMLEHNPIDSDAQVGSHTKAPLELTDRPESTSPESDKSNSLVANGAPDVENRATIPDISPDLNQTNVLVAANLESTDVSLPLDQTDVLVMNNLQTTDVLRQMWKSCASDEQLNTTEISPLERTDVIVANNLEDSLEATNLSQLVAYNAEQLSNDDSLLQPCVECKPEPIAEVQASDGHNVNGVTADVGVDAQMVDRHVEECPVEAREAETCPSDSREAESCPSDSREAETCPLDLREVETCPSDSREAETCPSDSREADTCPSDLREVETCPSDSREAETCPSDSREAESCPSDSREAETCPSDLREVETCPSDSREAETCPSDSREAETCPSDLREAETCPLDSREAETCPAETRETETCPSGTRETETCPSETRETETCPSETREAEICPPETRETVTCPSETIEAETCPLETRETETCPSDSREADTCPAETREADTCPSDSREAETCPSETREEEICPSETRETVTCPSETIETETRPSETRDAETCPSATREAETCPSETREAETRPSETREAETCPSETREAKTCPSETREANTSPSETREAGTCPSETREAETCPSETREAKTCPSETREAKTSPLDTREAGTCPSETREAETCPFETREGEAREAANEDALASSLDGSHALSLLAAENADPLSETGNLSDIVTLNAEHLLPDDSLLCEGQMWKKAGGDGMPAGADDTMAESDDTRPETDDNRPVTGVTRPLVDGAKPEEDGTTVERTVTAEAGVNVIKPDEMEVGVTEKPTELTSADTEKSSGSFKDECANDKEVAGSAQARIHEEDTDVTKAEQEVITSAKTPEVGLECIEPKADAVIVDSSIPNGMKDSQSDTIGGGQADMTVELSALVAGNLSEELGRSVDLSQLVASNKDFLRAEDSLLQTAVSSSDAQAPSAGGKTHVVSVTSDMSVKSPIEADAIKRIDSLILNLSQPPSPVEIKDEEHVSPSLIINESFVNTTDRSRRKKHASCSVTDTKTADDNEPNIEESLSLDKMVAINDGPCDGSMAELLKDNATPDSSLARLDPISRVDALIGVGATRRAEVIATRKLPLDVRKASQNAELTNDDDSFHTPNAEPVVMAPSKVSNPKLQNLVNHISSSEPKLDKQRMDACRGWSDSQSDTSDLRSLASLRTTASSNSSPLYSPNQVHVDAKRRFCFDTPQPVRFDHRSVLKEVSPAWDEKSEKSDLDMDRGITQTSTPIDGNTSRSVDDTSDVYFTPATSMKPKNKGKQPDIRKRVLMRVGAVDSSNGSDTSIPGVVLFTDSTSTRTQPIDIVGTNRERPSVAQSLPEQSFSVDSPYGSPPTSATPPPRGKAHQKVLKKQKSKDDEKENKKGKRRSFLSMFLPSKSFEKKEKGSEKSGKEKALSPRTPDKTDKGPGLKSGKRNIPEAAQVKKADTVKNPETEKKQVIEKKPAPVKQPPVKSVVRRPLTLTKDEAENRRSVYEEFGPLMGDMYGETWKEAARERLETVAPPPAKAPHTALLAPKAALEEFDTESEMGDDRMSVRSFQSQGLSEDESTRLHKKQTKAALRKRREQEQQRLHVAQQIQRQLEDVEMKQREVEQRGVIIERVLRGDTSDSQRDDAGLMQMWFNIVHEKNLLVRYESELMVHARELELEDRHSRLEQQYRERMQMNDAEKTVEMREEDERLLQELLEVVEQRDALVAMLDEDRVKQRRQDDELREMMLLKGYHLSSSIPEYKWHPPQSIFGTTSTAR